MAVAEAARALEVAPVVAPVVDVSPDTPDMVEDDAALPA
jgi:hypothetical protein